MTASDKPVVASGGRPVASTEPVVASIVEAPNEPVAALAGAPPARPSGRLVSGLGAAIFALAGVGYALTGSPSLAGLGAAAPVEPSGAGSGAAAPGGNAGRPPSAAADDSVRQIAAMVDTLAARMRERPNDAQGWVMLARSYRVLGRPAEAVPAYRNAARLRTGDSGLLADWADAIVASNDGRSTPEADALIGRALTIDPANVKALAIAGSAAFERGDFATAVMHWDKVAATLPQGSDLWRQVQASIAQARAAGKLAAGVASNAASASQASSAPGDASESGVSGRPRASTASDGSGKSIASSASAMPMRGDSPPSTPGAAVSGTITLVPALAANTSPDDALFVFARAAGGSPLPLAVMRARVSDLPLSFRLDDSMAMGPMAKLSSAASVVVAARISRSGDPLPHAGDLAGEAAPVAPGRSGISIVIDRVVRQ